MRSRVGAALVATTLVVVVVVGLAINGWSVDRLLNSCVGQEGDQLPELEQVTADVLRDVDASTSRYSGCEDRGEPDPAVVADVRAWTERSAANAYLADRGWEKVDDVLFASPDGEFKAQVIMTGEDRGPRYVTLYVMRA